MKLTICVYQNKIALPDILNWIKDKVAQNYVKSLSRTYTDRFIIELSYPKNDETIYERVHIIPDSAFEYHKNDLIKEINDKNENKFLYIGAFQKNTIQDIFDFYKKYFT